MMLNQAPPGNIFTANTSSPTASSAASSIPPAAPIPSSNPQDKSEFVFEDVCFLPFLSLLPPPSPSPAYSRSNSRTLFQRPQAT